MTPVDIALAILTALGVLVLIYWAMRLTDGDGHGYAITKLPDRELMPQPKRPPKLSKSRQAPPEPPGSTPVPTPTPSSDAYAYQSTTAPLDSRFTEPPLITTSEPKGPRIRYVDVDSYEDALKQIETGERSTVQEGLLKPCPECGGDLYPFTVYEHLFSRRLGKDGRPACSHTERRAGG